MPEPIVVDEKTFALVAELEVRKALRLQYPVSVLSIKGSLWLTKEDWKRATPAFLRGTLSGFFVILSVISPVIFASIAAASML